MPRRHLNIRVRAAIERFVLSHAHHIITLSEYMARVYREVYNQRMDVSVVSGGVDTDRFTPDVESAEYMTAGDPSFLTVRRLSPRMGHELLLEAFTTVVESAPDARLYIAGDGPLRAELVRKATRLGIDERTVFLGYVPDAELPGVYAAADCFILPTIELEGFGLATLEALASGTPVVATPVGATPELLGDLAADLPVDPLISAAESGALAEAMLGWTTQSASAWRQAGRACRRYACQHYSWEQTVTGLEAIYQETVSSS